MAAVRLVPFERSRMQAIHAILPVAGREAPLLQSE
jgi:hypothetical protein